MRVSGGKFMKIFNILLSVFFLSLFPFLVFAGEQHALLIGVDKYADTMIKGPGTAVNDAGELGAVLADKFGFKTSVLTGEKATGKNILSKIDEYSKKLSREDTLFIYFSGKTEVDPLNGQSWWMPYDAFYGDTLSYIDYSKASGILKNVKADTFIATNSSLPKDYSSFEPVKSKSGSGLGIKLILSSSGNQSASSVKSGLSVLGYSLIKAFKDADKTEVSASIISESAKKNALAQGVKLDFKVLGMSPVKTGDIKFVNLSVKKEIKEASIEKKESKPVEMEESVLNLFSKPAGADLFIDNKFRGKTPVEKIILKPGTHSLKLSKEGYKEKTESYTAGLNDNKKLEIVLEKLPPEKGSLTIKLNPEKGSVKFKNKDIDYKNKLPLEPGVYELILSAPFFKEKIVSVEIPEGKNVVKEENLTPLMSYTNSISQKFVRIKNGEFMMGTPESEFRRDPDENLHKVKISKDFFIMTKEVSLEEWKKFVDETGYKTESEGKGGALAWIGYKWDKSWKYSWKNPGFEQSGKEPVTCVTYNDAAAFAKWLSEKEGLNYTLPTEAQWEYSCRAGTESVFSYGNCLLDTQANFAANSKREDCPEGKNRNRTVETGKLEPNKWGLFDVHGNVMEWCLDFYSNYPEESLSDPSGPESGEYKVVRGCAWETDINNCRAGNRFSELPDSAKNNIGFRLVLNP